MKNFAYTMNVSGLGTNHVTRRLNIHKIEDNYIYPIISDLYLNDKRKPMRIVIDQLFDMSYISPEEHHKYKNFHQAGFDEEEDGSVHIEWIDHH